AQRLCRQVRGFGQFALVVERRGRRDQRETARPGDGAIVRCRWGIAMSEARYERSTELLEADLGDELMALDVARGSCFGFNSVATTIWRQLVSPKSFGELRDALLAEYEVGAEQ